MEFFIPIFPKSFLMILHKLLPFLIILSRSVQSISNNGHRTALTVTLSKSDLDVSPNPTIRFQISNIRWKAFFDTNPTVQVSGESDGRISRNVNSKSMVEIRELPRRVLFRPFNIYNIHILYIFHWFPFKTYYINRFKFVFKTISTSFQIQIKIEFFLINSF